MFKRINQRSITWKIRTGEQRGNNHRHDLINIPIKLHEDIFNGYRVMSRTIIPKKKVTKGHNLETKKGGTILCTPHCPDLIHIP